MNRAAQGVLALLVGGALLKISLADTYLRYVKAGLRPFLIAAGVVLVAIAVATLWNDVFAPRKRPLEPASADDDSSNAGDHLGPHHHSSDDQGAGDHDHAGHAEPRAAWFLLLPVVALLLVAPPALGSYAAGKSGTALSSQSDSDFTPLPAGDPVKLAVIDYAGRAVFDGGKSLAGRRVELTGFVLIGPRGRRYLARMVLTCCAADGRPVKIGLSGPEAPHDLPKDTWIRVTGRYDSAVDTDAANGGKIPYLAVESIEEIAAPTNPYE